MSEEN
jgi:ketosteroid isomerase-like protein